MYNIGDVCVRTFPSASAEENKTHEKRTVFFASDGPYQIRCRRSGVSTPPCAPFAGYAPLGGPFLSPLQPLRFCRGGFFGGRMGNTLGNRIFLRENFTVHNPVFSPRRRRWIRYAVRPDGGTVLPCAVRSPCGRRHTSRETRKETALQIQ